MDSPEPIHAHRPISEALLACTEVEEPRELSRFNDRLRFIVRTLSLSLSHRPHESGSFRSYSLSVRSFRPGSFRSDFWGESFRPSWGGSFRPYFIVGSFRPDFWGDSFWPDLFI